MKTMVIYDSTYGHTEKIARAIGEVTGGQVLHAATTDSADLADADVLILGSPTHGGFPTEAIDGLLKALADLEGTDVVAFDTRTKRTIFGYAAPKIARRLEKKGGRLLAPPEGFFVRGKKGPLGDGELERAVDWAEGIAAGSIAGGE
jgi:flavodoxin